MLLRASEYIHTELVQQCVWEEEPGISLGDQKASSLLLPSWLFIWRGLVESLLQSLGHFSSVQFSSVVSDSLWPHGLQHDRPSCPSPTPGVYSNSCLLSRWCHPTIPPSVIPFSSRLHSFPASGSFQMSQFSASGGQSIGVMPNIACFVDSSQQPYESCWLWFHFIGKQTET